MKKAIAYIRVSSESQEDNTSLEAQKSSIFAYAVKNDLDIIEVFKDVDSGANEHRQGLTRLREAIKSYPFDIVIVSKFDRFTRDIELGERVRKEIENAGGALVSASEAFNTKNYMDLAFVRMMQVFSALERDQIKNRLKSGKTQTVEQKGGWLGGTPPLGYKALGTRKAPAKGQLVVDEQEASIVRLCFFLKEEGRSFGEIASIVNSAGHKTRRGCNFDKTAIFRIIKRAEVYKQNKSINFSYSLNCESAKQDKIL